MKYVLDGHKLMFHLDRVKAWLEGERVAPITIDWALTQACPYNCVYCYAQVQQNPGRKKITGRVAFDFVDDASEIGVKAISLVSDGESTCVPFFYDLVKHGKESGLDMAVGTCGHTLKKEKLQGLLECLTYLRFNISAGEPKRYAGIHGVPVKYFYETCEIIKDCVRIKKDNGLDVTIGLQMVLMPSFADQVRPLVELGKELGVDYTILKHCSDDEEGSLGIDYNLYPKLYPLLEEVEGYSTEDYLVKAKWSKITRGNKRKYIQCFGPPLFLQASGSGVVAPCGSFFNPKYKKYWIGNIAEGDRLKELWQGDRYWEIMDLIASDGFDARKQCACLCLQDKVNEFLWDIKNGTVDIDNVKVPDEKPMHINFI